MNEDTRKDIDKTFYILREQAPTLADIIWDLEEILHHDNILPSQTIADVRQAQAKLRDVEKLLYHADDVLEQWELDQREKE